MTVYVRELAESLARRGLQTDIFTRRDADSPAVTELSRGVRVVSLDAGPRAPLPKDELDLYIGDFADEIKAFALGRQIRYDLVHSHYWQSGLAAAALADSWQVPLVHSHHTLGRVKNRFLAPGDTPEPEARLRGEEDVMAAADVLIASTDEEWEQLSCLYGAPHDRLKIIHPGVDHDTFTPGDRDDARAELGIGDELVLLSVGRIQPLKGLELAVRAVEQLRSALETKLRLLIVGGASGRGGAAEVRRLNGLVDLLHLREEVRFAGPQPHANLPVFYRAADVLLVCSHSESFGLAALEAHACGTPVVGTAVGGLSYIVRDGESGFLIEERDPASFATRLKALVSDEEVRASFSKRALTEASRFSWTTMAGEFLELYECLVEGKTPQLCTC
jgi:D-inositol-3-phosphate glycosyltransferase